jgi:hypothetical protein
MPASSSKGERSMKMSTDLSAFLSASLSTPPFYHGAPEALYAKHYQGMARNGAG